MSIRNIFLDDGGVLNDNNLRGPQWQRLVGEFIAPRLGREPREWAQANKDSFDTVFSQYLPRWEKGPLHTFWNNYHFDWLRVMCEHVGTDVPMRDEAVAIALEASAYVTRRVHAAFPEVVDVVRQLHGEGYNLHTASGGHSDQLAGYLEAMGIRDLFGRLYGPDLLGLPLYGPQYYQRLFEDSGTEADEAIVVDDSPERVPWVMDAGASAVLVVRDGPAPDVRCPVISSLAELPALLERLGSPESH